MKKLLTLSLAIIIMLISNMASADLPDPYAEVRKAMEVKYNDQRDLIKESMKIALLDNNIISLNFKLPEKCDYNCVIYDSPFYFGRIEYNPYKRYYGAPNPFNRFPSPLNEEMIKQFDGAYDGVNDITETFKYKTPEKKESKKYPVSNYLLKIECHTKYKETAFGSKMLKNPTIETFWYKISVKREHRKNSVEIS